MKPADEPGMDSVKESRRFEGRRAFDVLMEAQRHWDNMDRFRKDRERNKRYCYGDQWGDMISVDGNHMTEEEYIKRRGQVPLKNNLIRRLVRNVLGAYRSQNKEPTCTARDREEQRLGEAMSITLQYNMQLNRMNELLARTVEEFLISGFAVHRKWYGWRNDKLDCWTDYIQPNNFFIDSNMRDPLGRDVSCLGEVHDIDFGTLVSTFASSPSEYKRLRDIYSNARIKDRIVACCEQFGYSRLENHDFLFTSEPGRCRVIEVWRKETKPRYRCHDYNTGEVYKIELEDYQELVGSVNADRIAKGMSFGIPKEDIPLIEAEWFIDQYWYFYYLSPFGHILKEGETPYEHKEHPYVFKAYPFIDGEIHSFVKDVIDQQRYVNRLITMYDWIMRASAKGVLLVPEECLGSHSPQEFAEEWSRVDGVIIYRAKPGVPAPQQVAANSTNIGINELLNLQLKFFEDISGVHGALQGKPGNSGMSGTLYAQQAQNATTSLLDLLEAFSSFTIDGAYKDLKNLQQFYDEKRFWNIAGSAGLVNVDPAKIRDVECDISIEQSTTSAAYREYANEFLLKLLELGLIPLEPVLENGTFPFADKLLQSLRSSAESLQQGQPMQGIDPSLLQQAQQGADMNAVNRAYAMLKAA